MLDGPIIDEDPCKWVKHNGPGRFGGGVTGFFVFSQYLLIVILGKGKKLPHRVRAPRRGLK